MIKSCRNINIRDEETVFPWVLDCISRHRKRHDFRELITGIGGMDREEYDIAIKTQDMLAFHAPARKISRVATRCIAKRQINLPRIHIRERLDKSSGKIRPIGVASAMQQVFDYIAVYSCNEIWDRRIVQQQVSSRKEMGPIVGARMIQRWKQKDNRAARWAARHGKRYSKKTKYYVKLDIKKCYASLRISRFMKLFRRDCGNEDILWLWEQLLISHLVDGNEGFLIGALISERACQYMISFAWRFAMGQHKIRRGRSVQLISHGMTYMDDIVLTGPSRRDMLVAIRKLTRMVDVELGLQIKSGWHVCDWAVTPLDCMGYVIYDNGRMAVRPRVFVRARRSTLRAAHGRIPLERAQRVLSYKGYFEPGRTHRTAARRGKYPRTNSRKVIRWMAPVWERCTAVVSAAAKNRPAALLAGA